MTKYPTNKSHAHRTDGFTLAELLAVVAIIAVLVAVSVPIFSSQTAKAKAAADQANVRSAKAAAVSAYMTESIGEETTYYYDAASGTVTSDYSAAASIAGYGKSTVAVEGASGLPNKNGKAQIITVSVAKDGTCSMSWGLGTDLDSYLVRAGETAQTLSKYYSDTDLIHAMKALEEFPSTSVSSIFNDAVLYNSGDTLYWRPKNVTINGTATMILYAYPSDTDDHANWKAYAFYYNGTIYRSTNINQYNQKIDNNNITANSQLTDAVNGSTDHWEAVQ